jgi:hypothetical protein
MSRRSELAHDESYRTLEKIARVMDDYYIDPLLGLLPVGIGDMISSIVVIPFIYTSLVRLKSIPLTLAVLFNILKDILLGMLPFFIGDVIDVFYKSHKRNLDLVTGFVNNDRQIIQEVNRKAIWAVVAIAITCVLIYYVGKLIIELGDWAWNLISQ